MYSGYRSTYRRLQAVSDLTAQVRHLVARDGIHPGLARAADLLAAAPEERPDDAWLDALVTARDLAKRSGSQPEKTAALAVLLADAMSGGVSVPDRYTLCVRFADFVADLPHQPRATLSNAMREIQRALSLPDYECVPPEHCLSQPTETLSAALCTFAKTLPHDLRAGIAEGDYGRYADRYLSDLNLVLSDPECRLSGPGHEAYPDEVVHLHSHAPEAPGAAQCMALILNWAILPDPDPGREHPYEFGDGHVEFRWDRSAAVYKALDEPVRTLLLDGFRHVYEAYELWDPKEGDWGREHRVAPGLIIPWRAL